MHRQISHHGAFQPASNLGLYLFTALLGVLIGLDWLWPALAEWANPRLGLNLPLLKEGLVFAGYKVRFALIAALLGGTRVAIDALDALLAGRVGADLALVLASVAAICINQPLVAAEVVFIGLVGECLEAWTFDRTQKAVRRLIELCPTQALLLRDGREIRTPVEDLRAGDRVLVRPGKRVPVDGVVAEGRSALDQAALTGESVPVEKGPGDAILAGTVNQHGALVVEVRRIAEFTVMGRVIAQTAQALKNKANVERTADHLARYFLPVVLALAALTFLAYLWWFRGTADGWRQAVFPALAVLVVACPCALILATPAAVIAAIGRLAGTGVHLKGGDALERLAAVDTIAFDKTGTLTTGKHQLGDVLPLTPELTADDLLRLAAAAEQRSEHLLAQVIVQAARDRQLDLPAVADVTAHPGGGVEAILASGEGEPPDTIPPAAASAPETLLVGNRRFLEGRGVLIPEEAAAALARLDAAGQTAVLVARLPAGHVLGILGARDTVRPEAAAVLRQLAPLGITRIALLTGDRPGPARLVAEELAIAEVKAELLPPQKAEWVEACKAEGRRVAMVGDGINDAPALAKADVGLALGNVGSDVAAEAGDVVFLGDPLAPLPLLIRLSRQTVTIIRQNVLWFAFGVNVVGVVLTAWILPAWSEAARQQAPLWAAIYHQVGSLAVLINAMRLLWFERAGESKTWTRVRSASESFDRFLERLSLHDFLHWLEDHWPAVTAGGGAAALLLYFGSGVTVIGPDEIGIVRRCGQALPNDLGPGLHYRYPWPWETVTRVQPERLRSVEVGFRALEDGGPEAQTWASAHGQGTERRPAEGLMMTGDGNLVEVQIRVFFTLAEPRVYLFEVVEPDEVLRALTEAVVRQVLAERAFLPLFTSQREAFQQEVTARLQARLAEPAYRLGLAVQSVAFQDLHPPQELVDAYYDVTKALTRKDRVITEERTRRDTAISREEVARQRVRAEAQAAADALTTRTAAERDAFRALVAVQRAERWAGLVLPAPGPAAPWQVAQTTWTAAQRAERADLPRQLVEFRLYLEAAEAVLAGRPKILRDPAIRGALTVLPDLFKLRLPPLGRDREAMPPRAGHGEGP